MKACIRDCFEKVKVLNRTLSSKSKLTLQGRSDYWEIQTKENWVARELSVVEVSLYLDGIEWGLKNQ